jgi:hypothetical protein
MKTTSTATQAASPRKKAIVTALPGLPRLTRIAAPMSMRIAEIESSTPSTRDAGRLPPSVFQLAMTITPPHTMP